jgi:hypothetical protein
VWTPELFLFFFFFFFFVFVLASASKQLNVCQFVIQLAKFIVSNSRKATKEKKKKKTNDSMAICWASWEFNNDD